MAIKRFGDYEKTQAYGDYEALPKGGYVVKILGAEVCNNSVGQYVKISCDIAEGEYAGFYAKEYKAQQSEDKKWHCNHLLYIPNDDGSEKDNWTKRRFKTFTEALEESKDLPLPEINYTLKPVTITIVDADYIEKLLAERNA